MKYKIVLLTVFVASLMIIGAANSTALAVDQTTDRPDLLIKSRVLTSRMEVFKGNTSESKVELLLTRGRADSTSLTLRGNPTLRYLDNITVNMDGTVNGSKVTKYMWFKGFIQRDSYIEDVPVGKRITRSDKGRDVNVFQLTDNRTYTSGYDFDTLNSIENVTKRTARNGAITAFIFRTGFLKSVDLNETTGQVFAFSIQLKIAVFQTATKKLIGVYKTTDAAVGNILPKEAVEYVRTHGFPYRGKAKALGQSMISSPNATRIAWIYKGYNDTLGLDIYRAFFAFKRTESMILFNPNAAAYMRLAALSTEDEDFANSLVSDNTIAAFDVDNMLSVEDEAVKATSADAGVDLENLDVSSSVTSTPADDVDSVTTPENKAIFIGQSLALLALGVIAVRRLKKSL